MDRNSNLRDLLQESEVPPHIKKNVEESLSTFRLWGSIVDLYLGKVGPVFLAFIHLLFGQLSEQFEQQDSAIKEEQ